MISPAMLYGMFHTLAPEDLTCIALTWENLHIEAETATTCHCSHLTATQTVRKHHIHHNSARNRNRFHWIWSVCIKTVFLQTHLLGTCRLHEGFTGNDGFRCVSAYIKSRLSVLFIGLPAINQDICSGWIWILACHAVLICLPCILWINIAFLQSA